MVHVHSHEEGAMAPLPPQEVEKVWQWALKSSKVYSCAIGSIFTGCITAWYGNNTALDCMVRTGQYITGAEFTAIQDLYQAV
jgi:hypothetical protein